MCIVWVIVLVEQSIVFDVGLLLDPAVLSVFLADGDTLKLAVGRRCVAFTPPKVLLELHALVRFCHLRLDFFIKDDSSHP